MSCIIARELLLKLSIMMEIDPTIYLVVGALHHSLHGITQALAGKTLQRGKILLVKHDS